MFEMVFKDKAALFMKMGRLGQDSRPDRGNYVDKDRASGGLRGASQRSTSRIFVIRGQNVCGKELAGNKLKR